VRIPFRFPAALKEAEAVWFVGQSPLLSRSERLPLGAAHHINVFACTADIDRHLSLERWGGGRRPPLVQGGGGDEWLYRW